MPIDLFEGQVRLPPRGILIMGNHADWGHKA